jgi:hypothetical protein
MMNERRKGRLYKSDRIGRKRFIDLHVLNDGLTFRRRNKRSALRAEICRIATATVDGWDRHPKVHCSLRRPLACTFLPSVSSIFLTSGAPSSSFLRRTVEVISIRNELRSPLSHLANKSAALSVGDAKSTLQ